MVGLENCGNSLKYERRIVNGLINVPGTRTTGANRLSFNRMGNKRIILLNGD